MKPYTNFGSFINFLENYGDRPAITMRPSLRTQVLSYAQLVRFSRQTANYLRSKNIKSGDRIMVVSPNRPEWPVLFLACQLIGCTLVPVDAQNNLETVEIFIAQTKPKLVFRELYILAELDNKYDCQMLDDLQDLVKDQSAIGPKSELTGEESAVIVFTSGTTAAPKGVVISQKAILSNLFGLNQVLVIESDWRFLSVLPLSHMYELTAGCMAPLSRGASIFLCA
jgi:long-chain acyl-CoA synthetase